MQSIADYLRDSLTISERVVCTVQRQSHDRLQVDRSLPAAGSDMQTPAARYEPSPWPMPHKLPPLEYLDRFEVRYDTARACGRVFV
jgi:hypothetical protein